MNHVGLLLFLVVYPSSGFLLDDRTTAVPVTNGISERQFNALVSLFSSERDARIKLEEKVTHLENELIVTQKGLTDVYHDNQQLNSTVADQNRILASILLEHNALKAKYDVLEHANKELGINLTRTEMELENMKNRLGQLEQMKTVSELQLVLNLQNDTRHLQDELKSTNVKLDHVANENNARKDDIIALYNTVNNNEIKFVSFAKNTSEAINRTSHDIVEKISKNISALSQHQNQTAEQLTQKIVNLDQFLNVTSNRLDRELRNMSGRAVLTSCAVEKTYSINSNILFPNIRTRYGVGDSVISELGTAGNYRVESSGVYLISAFILTKTNGYFYVYVNNQVVAYGYFSLGTNFMTTAVTVSKRLEKHDMIYIRVSGSIYIYGITQSCLTILQLTKD